MKINCKEISINDEELGCQVTFSENEDLGAKSENMTFKEIIDSIGKYLLLQRSYPEDEFATGNYYFETLDENFCGDLVDYEMVLTKTNFELKFTNEKIEISICPTEKEFSKLKRVLRTITNKNGKLIVNE